MLFAIKLVILIGLVKLLQATGKPVLVAGIYAVLGFVITLLFGFSIGTVLLATAINFLLALLYFWLLQRTEDSWLWWVVLIGGLLIGLV